VIAKHIEARGGAAAIEAVHSCEADIRIVEPRFKKYMDPKKMPFDGKRMFWGGFRAMAEY
jgi:uncharacterized protein YbaA (DUF1428 family)